MEQRWWIKFNKPRDETISTKWAIFARTTFEVPGEVKTRLKL